MWNVNKGARAEHEQHKKKLNRVALEAVWTGIGEKKRRYV